jgi:hypothetical protein
MDGPGSHVEGGTGLGPDGLESVRRGAERDLGEPGLQIERLVLSLVPLERERLPLPNEQDLPAVAVGECEVELVAPGLCDTSYGLLVRCQRRLQSGLASTNSRAMRSSFGVLTVNQTPSWKNARRRRSAASSGNVVRSWSPRSGSRSTASSPRT